MYFETIAEEKVAALEISGLPLNRYKDGLYLKKIKDAGTEAHSQGGFCQAWEIRGESRLWMRCLPPGVEEGGHPLNENVATTVLDAAHGGRIEDPCDNHGRDGRRPGVGRGIVPGG